MTGIGRLLFEMVKMNKKYSGMKVVLLAVLVVAVLNACATVPGSGVKMDASSEVKLLAQSRWDALVRGDVTAAYGYMSPASKASMSLVQYQQKIHVGFWKKAVVDAVSCEPEACKVDVTITYDYQMTKGVETPLIESWVKDDGKWWFVLRK